jgi:uncharacterized membrane protein YedE/YeeE
MDFIKQPWPWYIAGPLIGLIVPTLLVAGNKAFGISSSLRHICAICMPADILFFKYDWKKEIWNLFFVAGIIIGGFATVQFLGGQHQVQISDSTTALLKQQGIKDFKGLLPHDIFSLQQLLTLREFVFIIIGGFLVGFGTRYAGVCTSGHAIMGISTLQWPSLVATCCFMIGGLVMIWLILPYLIQL